MRSGCSFVVVLWLFPLLFLLAAPGAGQEFDGAPPSGKDVPGGLAAEKIGTGAPCGELLAKNFFEELMDSSSKERKIFNGALSVFSSFGNIDFASERKLGESLALEGFLRFGFPVENPELQKYVNLVGMAVAVNSDRPLLPYRFVVVASDLYNAFACPGGIIFVSSGLVALMDNEAELAGVLAHEVAHVTHKHALKSLKRTSFLDGVSKITAATMRKEEGAKFEKTIDDLQSVLFEHGLEKGMEYQADLSAMEIAYRTGYAPSGLIDVLRKMEASQHGGGGGGAERRRWGQGRWKERQAQVKAPSPKARGAGPGSWFSTHPPLSSRINKCTAEMSKYPDGRGLASNPERFQRFSALSATPKP